MGYYDSKTTTSISHYIKLAAVILAISWILNISAQLTMRFRFWVLVSWLIIYGRIWLVGMSHEQAVVAGSWHPDLASHSSWPVIVLDSVSASHAGIVQFGIVFSCIVALLGLIAGGLRYGSALLCFWGPLFFIPMWLEHVGLLVFHMGGTVAWIAHFQG